MQRIIDISDGSSDDLCQVKDEIERERVALTEALMTAVAGMKARIDQQDQKIAAQTCEMANVRSHIGQMADMLRTMGDLCRSLAIAAEQLSA